ncbi:DUF1206 domain-containing protein [Cryobacterium sp. TMT4-10]|uniref:DUF1206 domain-containing protein n=1 Tax=Cryobacterium sp. TMT4-10 TaxID=1259256 RepID=UPI00106B6BA8|nr:DUF1206 domain-containing protein [Cryobacterium sp. TMT4-10]TFD19695.1 DUF1206 domain-containing protein [Cryobacterium sp. TMT4-10]
MTPESVSDNAQDAARTVEGSRTFQLLARAGYAVNGLLHVMIGSIAISVATGAGAGGGSADQSGALGQLARTPGGVFLLWTVVIGLAALGLWYLVQAFVEPARDPKRKWAKRAVLIGKGAVFLLIAATALTFARGATASSSETARDSTATLLGLPGGVILLFIGGLVVLGIGAVFVVRGASHKFTESITVPRGAAGTAVVALGTVGYSAEGIALGTVGVLFAVAAFTHNPDKATGMDGALKALVALPFGVAILVVVGAGLIAYGLYCFARSRLARL